MTIASAISGIASAATSAVAGPAAAKGVKTAFDAILDELKKVGHQTPMERARDAVLKKHALTDEQYQALPASQRTAIDKEIAEAVRKVAEAQMKPKRADGGYA
ncbi:hypothetical protein KFK14_06625 [Sphingobium phenoxybenzoativorans]|uniref:Uncharacterized protein n=1 Tax=Sphingobium phenoxybenzoativorans TaxID=1592790 RepID=A0A975Q331_9SPHN|nr:hypothetical protein [Sphingobium phenoxybenzoativorans]QUT07092.1 hypothetical protein KFK14_06625 [Sphingobium phenoxybenzoativorans]